MSSVNLGQQYVALDYQAPFKAIEVNRMLRGLLPAGIYSGGNITVGSGGTQILMFPFRAFFNINSDYGCNIRTEQTITFSGVDYIDPSKPYFYMKYDWVEEMDKWVDFAVTDDLSTIPSNGILIGVINYSGGLVSSVDISGRKIEGGFIDVLKPIIMNDVMPVGSFYTEKGDGVNPNTLYPEMTWILETEIDLVPQEYIQYEGKPLPTALYPGTTWEKAVRNGDFLRQQGTRTSFGQIIGKANLGEVENDQMQRITGNIVVNQYATGGGVFTGITGPMLSQSASGISSGKNFIFNSSTSPNARTSSSTAGETRPVNTTVCFWKRTDSLNTTMKLWKRTA